MRSFLTLAEETVYSRFTGPPEQAVRERFFFLDDADRDLVAKRRGDHNRLGFALQLVTVRWLGTFLTDPLDVPLVVLDYVAAQVEVQDPSCVKRYTDREKTRLEHQWEIAQVGGFVSFASAQVQLVEWLDRRAWTTGDGPKAFSGSKTGTSPYLPGWRAASSSRRRSVEQRQALLPREVAGDLGLRLRQRRDQVSPLWGGAVVTLELR